MKNTEKIGTSTGPLGSDTMSGAWMVEHGTDPPVGECIQPLRKLSNAAKMDQHGEVVELNTIEKPK